MCYRYPLQVAKCCNTFTRMYRCIGNISRDYTADTASPRSIVGLCTANTAHTCSILRVDTADSDTPFVLEVYYGVRYSRYDFKYFGMLYSTAHTLSIRNFGRWYCIYFQFLILAKVSQGFILRGAVLIVPAVLQGLILRRTADSSSTRSVLLECSRISKFNTLSVV